jgi:hypothetical protein
MFVNSMPKKKRIADFMASLFNKNFLTVWTNEPFKASQMEAIMMQRELWRATGKTTDLFFLPPAYSVFSLENLLGIFL